jgi:erythromycin esterase
MLARLVAFVVFTAAAAAATGAESQGAIEGAVLEGGQPVAGALVAVVAPQAHDVARAARTDATGHFRFAPLAPGRYGVTATADGRTGGLALDVDVARAGTTQATITLGGDFRVVRGTIRDAATGEPVAGARLSAVRSSEVDGDIFAVDVTAGAFNVRLPRASYTLHASAPGHAVTERWVTMANDAPITLFVDRSWPAGPAPQAVMDWLRTNAIPLSTVEANHGFADLARLGDAIGDARIVALGESTHGTREFFQLKHRLLEWLVGERGFTVFAIEATMPESFDLNDYVLTGRGDPSQLLGGLHFWVWDTEEVLDLIRWMRHWNEDPSHPRVKFYGFDMQYAPRALEGASRYVQRVAPDEHARLFDPLAVFRYDLDARTFRLMPPETRKSVRAAAQALLDRFDAARAAWTKRSSTDAWEVARQHARVLVQFIDSSIDVESAVRDAAMAENLQWIAEHEHARVVAWAHNDHVGHVDDGWLPMGEHLRRALGRAYVAVGLLFDHGGFVARDPAHGNARNAFTVAGLPPGSTGATFAATGLPRFIVDLRSPPSGVVSDWLRSRHATWDVGSWYSPDSFFAKGLQVATARKFDVVAFVAATTPSHQLHDALHWDSPTPAAQLANAGFEDGDAAQPSGWGAPGREYRLVASSKQPFEGQRCGLLQRSSAPQHDGSYGTVEQYLDAKLYRGARLQLSAAVRAEVPKGSSARLYLIVDENGNTVAMETMRERPITKRGWQQYESEVPISAKATGLYVGVALMGSGSVCFDKLQLRASSATRE